ncbi:MAG: alpha/beta fold hydrolase, partial [Pyrinomonadaceae bacterium]
MKLLLKQALLAAFLMIPFQSGPATAQETPTGLASRIGLPPNFNQIFTHNYAKANGIRLHYVAGGPTNGQMVVLLHGWPQTWYTWRRVMPALTEAGYRVVAVDYRGAGESEKPAGGYDKATMTADI